ncbi:MAG: hypothetical protein M1837_005102 [Sclerophora amabilis]|nr:MAG: hypothetical protein M1837_005102 [Sclerophora amabilis]
MSNETNTDNCTLATCSIAEDGQLHYIPSLPGNAFYLGLFGLVLVGQLFLGIRYRTWGFLGAMVGGLALEILGYVARIQLHDDVFDSDTFIIYLIGLTIGPAFFSAAIYLCLARIIAVYGHGLSFFKPRTITCVFILCDLVSLILQAAGGAITSTSDTIDDSQMGVDIMIAGLSSQVVSMFVFVLVCGYFAWKVRRNPQEVNQNTLSLQRTKPFRAFLCALIIATITILVRCSFRVAELQEGFDGAMANDEILFMILEGAMIVTAVTALTVAHPGPALGPMWKDGVFHFRTRNNGPDGFDKSKDGSYSEDGTEFAATSQV